MNDRADSNDRSMVIGVDMGGTTIKAAAFSKKGTRLASLTDLTRDDASTDGPPEWAVSVGSLVAKLESECGARAQGVGLACPGLAHPNRRWIASLPKRLPGLEGFDWTEFLDRSPLVPVMNDAHAALMGEVWQGAAKGCRDVVLVTLGTGVGGAILSEGRLLRGRQGRAGHLGHICIQKGGPASIVGTPGALEWYVGNYTLAERSGGQFHETRDLAFAVERGQPDAVKLWNEMLDSLGCGLVSLINVLDPEVILLGGGIAEAGEALIRPLQERLDAWEWRPDGRGVELRSAALGEWAGAVGAAFEALRSG